MLRVAQACAFAHDHGVVHRDVKPANIMIGDYGEVLLLDWGVARVLGTCEGRLDPVTTWRSDDEHDRTIVGTVAGTPAYMPPEQAKGEIDLIGPASDVYSIGVVIYEFIVGRRPFRASSVRELLDKVAEEDIVPPSRRPDRRHEVPPDLESLINRCLKKDPEQRFPNGMALAQALEGFLEGSRRRDESERLAGIGDEKASAYRRAADAARRKEDDLQERRLSTAPWAPAEVRQQVWAEEAAWRELRRIRDNTYDEAISLYQSALKADSDNQASRDGLAGLYVRRMEEAERRGELATSRFYRSQALRFDTGRFRPHIQGPFKLFVRSDRPSAQVRVQRVLLSRDRVLRPGEATELGEAPLDSVALEPGSWLLTMSAQDGSQIRLPVYAHLPKRLELEANFEAASRVAAGYIFIPGGPFTAGGDPMAIDAPPLEERSLTNFAISRHPITQAEFSVFLEEEGTAAGFDSWIGPDDISSEERPRLPALGVTRYAAEAYAEWLSRRGGGPRFRLPTNDEWEKAARGVDRRSFPWGNDWEPTFCNSPDSFAKDPRPREVGCCPQDCSIYGVFDLAGGVAEWVSDAVPHRPDQGWVRGGSWNSHRRGARISSRGTMLRTSSGGTLGFRLVQELEA
jgi:serine/threonine-protein kinase